MSEEKKDKYGVPVEIPHYHEPNPSAGLTEEAARQLDLAMWEMNSDVVVDESAAPTFEQADVTRPGTYGESYGRVEGVTTSPKIPFHDNVWSSLKSKHTYLDSGDIEEMMAYIYGGLSPAEASVDNYEAYDRTRYEEMMALDQVAAEKFVGAYLFGDSETGEEEQEQDDE